MQHFFLASGNTSIINEIKKQSMTDPPQISQLSYVSEGRQDS